MLRPPDHVVKRLAGRPDEAAFEYGVATRFSVVRACLVNHASSQITSEAMTSR